jgi:deoxyadenosine/deoxycytidine kinase
VSTFEDPTQNESGACPHFNEIEEETLRRLFSTVAAVRSKDADLFSFTHRPMKVFAGAEETWTEERIYQKALSEEGRVENSVIVIEGEVGTGKSELCAYLSHRLRSDNRPVLDINKNDDLMSILSERIPEFYKEHFNEKLPGADKFKNLHEDIEDNPETVAANAITGAILNLRQRGYENIKLTPDQRDKISDLVAKKLINQFMERGDFDKKVRFVEENEIKQEEYLQIFSDSVDSEKAAEELNMELWREIRERYGTSSLDDVLERVGKKFEEDRPAIVFEDFSIAAVEAKQLANYMERDNANEWDFIIAGTRDSTEVLHLHTQTSKDRFHFFQTNKKDTNNVLFLNKKNSVEFIRTYLGYIKSHDESVRYERDGESYNLISAPTGSICADCGFCDEDFRDLYPFNEVFLRRIFSGLDEDAQSPREYVMAVFDVLEEFHYGGGQAPSSAEALKKLRNRVSVVDKVYDDAEEYADLAKWYGTEEESCVAIDRKFVNAFGLETEDLPDEIEFEEGVVRVRSEEIENGGGSGGDSDSCPECGAPTLQTKGNGSVVCSSCGEVVVGADPVQEKIRESKEEVDSWLENPDKYPDTNMYIRKGIRDLIEKLTDGFKLYEGGDLLYNLSSQKDPFVYSDSNQAPKEDQIVVDRKDFQRSDLRQLVEFGVRREEEPRSADYEEQYERIGAQVAGYAQSWRQRIFETQLQGDETIYKRHARFEFSDLLLASYSTLCLLDDPTEPPTAEYLNERYQSDEDLSVDHDLRSPLKEVLDVDDYSTFEEAMRDAEYVESLVGEIFGVSSNSLDAPAVRNRLQDSPPYAVLKLLGRGNIKEINARLRFDTGHNVKDFADNMYDVRKGLDEVVDHGFDEEVVDYVNETIAGTDMSEVESKYKSLKTYDSVNKDFLEELGKLCEYTDQDVNDVEYAAGIANELSNGNGLQRIAAALISLKLDNMEVVQQFRSVPLMGGREETHIGNEFREVSKHYVS